MSRGLYIGIGIVASVGAATWYLLTRIPSSPPGQDGATDIGTSDYSLLDEVTVNAKKLVGSSWPYPRGAEYQSIFDSVSQSYGIPTGLLARQGWQESRFRPEIIDGSKISSAGAIGIMQIVPHWHPDVNPYDPIESINYAGKYLRSLFDQFGTWDLALAAYNWGPGNISKNPSPAKWPKETQNYVAQITSDVPVENA